ncbi:putative nucleic acid-binding Zn-ribbon protein [Methylobacterium sp. PvP062]|uniref:Nucleic acid-binding Zn-ribbon protein n=1 Tax=Methylobacterium radiotolerans TaxID=31998 RepID=A0ABV2NLC0_9HYPH|nr:MULTISPECIES: hypothetical protein [unclassified Methylobacterium]KZC01445.1 hypothetical protein AU375_02369 [Methylobacterium radiotolerans]MBP2496044.1 putative nucleic acid-binding Zn-ribbon protein [Methylobacterium sp. PvP105]MBP2504085.1 putative nucleic acid-binding Zn-ribbon protein [Methylobacterium sp. PvP109]MCX7333122.1 hypothetical protein [Hyphomicrobiales bacterium]
MSSRRFLLRRMAFTGSAVPVSDLDFVPGINLVWGASSAGKSFVLAALDFMLGAGSLPEIRFLNGYERGWLTLDLPTSGRVTLARAVSGGHFDLYDGDVDPRDPGQPIRTLSADHKATRNLSISAFLLGELGIGDKLIDRTLNAEKNTFTFRHFAPYVLTDETSMMAERSPTEIDPRAGDTFNKNVFKFLLTGIDGSSTVTMEKSETQRRGNAGKLELIVELLAAAEEELAQGWPDASSLEGQEERIEEAIKAVSAEAATRQDRLDSLRSERREAMEAVASLEDRLTEITLTLGRFDLLAAVYASDVARLASLAEGGAALLAGSRRPCPHCGADPEHQRHSHGLDEIGRTHVAVEAEIAKIRSEQDELRRTVADLLGRQDTLGASLSGWNAEVGKIDRAIEAELPLESSIRFSYERHDRERERIRRGLSVQRRIDDLQARKREIEAFKPTSLPRGSVVPGVSGSVGDEFAADVQTILRAWQFPGPPRVSFDSKKHDILLNGENRRGNGKGVRGLMQAAFKIGVLVYCRRHGLPHPGIIALDSPLLSFRDPHTSKYGELSEDERVLSETQLKHRFYDYLIRTAGSVQYVIIENDAPPIDLGPDARITIFAGERGVGDRKGFFRV